MPNMSGPPEAIPFEKLRSQSKIMQNTALPILWELLDAEEIIKHVPSA